MDAKIDQKFMLVRPRARPPLPRMVNLPKHSTINRSTESLNKSDSSDAEGFDDVDRIDRTDSSPFKKPHESFQNGSFTKSGSVEKYLLEELTPDAKNKSANKSNLSMKSGRLNKSNQLPQKKIPSRRTSESDEQKKNYGIGRIFCICVVLIGVVVAIVIGAGEVGTADDVERLKDDQAIEKTMEDLENNIENIRSKFKGQYSHVWNDVGGRIAEVVRNPKRPTIIILFASEEQPMFCLARMLGNASKAALQVREDLLLSPNDLGEDYGMVIEKWKEIIQQRKVVIFENLLDIHVEAMKAFHNLCDSENPLVSEAVFIFMMVVKENKNQPMDEHESMIFIEEQLTKKLMGKVDDEKLQPLITRITDAAIIHVQPEPGVTSCPIRY